MIERFAPSLSTFLLASSKVPFTSLVDHAVQGASADAAAPPPMHNGDGSDSSSVGRTGDQAIDGLLSGARWNETTITYSDTDSAADYGSSYSYDDDGDGRSVQNDGFSQFSATQLLTVHTVLNEAPYGQLPGAAGLSVEGFTNLGLLYAGAGSGTATIRVANSNDPKPDGNTAYAWTPDDGIYGGDAWFDRAGDAPVTGNYDHHAIMHELGHSLGLKHGQETDGFGAMPNNRNSMEYSVMTYRSFIGDTGSGYNNEAWGYAQTWMMYDIAALQHMYGADYTANSGNTTYTWNQFTGEMRIDGELALQPGDNRIFSTIWDGGGTDTYDLSNYSTDLEINLAPGSHSTFSEAQLADLGGGPNGGMARGNVFNALMHDGDTRSLIENANGGWGDDQILGNTAANVLRGNSGADVLKGMGGDDILYGGNQDDSLYGGSGNDTLYGENGNDYLDGSAGNDYLDGGAGKDRLQGGGGNDILKGLGGDDSLVGGSGDDTLWGGSGNDTLLGGRGVDVLSGGAGSDVFEFTTVADSTPGSVDTISDFSNAGRLSGDILDFSTIDADLTLAGNQAFQFGGSQGAGPLFTGKGYLWFTEFRGSTYVNGNVDGSSDIDFQVRIDDGTTLASAYTAADFIA